MSAIRPIHALLGVLLLVAALLVPLSVAAQGRVAIETLTVAIWPEFDRPAALVFYKGIVAEGTSLPVRLRFIIPSGAAVHAVAYQLPDGQLVNASFSIVGSTLTVTSPNGTFHVEFYDPALAWEGDERRYALEWVSEYDVGNLIWEVQQPAEASNLSLTPGESTLTVDAFGLPLYRISAGPVLAGESARIEVRYTRPTTALTVELLQAAEMTVPTRRGVSNTAFLIAVGAIVAALAAVAGYFYAGRKQLAAKPTPAKETALPAEETPLSARELEVLKLLAEGLGNREIGARLGISPKTVARHRENLMAKLDLHSRTELVKYAIRIGLIDLDAER